MERLSIWLLFVAALRLFSVYLGLFKPNLLQIGLFSRIQLVDVHARTFATWTSLTCILCIVTAFNLESAPIYFTTIFSFVLAIAHLGTEAFVFKTIGPKQLISPGLTAGITAVWMFLAWNDPVFGSASSKEL
ncbi:hypothetical protein KFL_000080420 [Klebsormidium nitens]|uniref:Ergosterol biosynthetic protein 28 n=1 Tax=Klebsormidium nitens TaxID=105231 RepID=A0A1Y1HNE9_KLENI|nr:hypothetical protein KFL_000080420 [Klebsormidium nitens]|eukprot:GAQ78136.1 hypothetical protein KFL_000080420 [Klebsormidium nitens]